MGRAIGDRNLEVGRHAHAQRLKTIARRDLGELAEVRSGVLIMRRNAHEAIDREAKLVSGKRYEGVGISWQHAGFLRLLAGIDLDEETRHSAFLRGRCLEGVGELGPIERFDDIEKPHSLARLVGLQGADEMKLRRRIIRLEPGPFGESFLDPIFAEDAVAGLKQRADRLSLEGLGDGDERDRAGRPAGRGLGGADFVRHLLVPFEDLGRIDVHAGA